MYLVNLSQDKSKLSPYISNTLLSQIEKNLRNNKKIILYLNKRWEFSSLICESCNYFYKCPNCDTSLVIHNYSTKLICHICNYSENIPKTCKKCWSKNLKAIWVGTQQIENSLKSYFKNTKIYRMDLDIVKNKKQKLEALQNLENAQIIIWTKMITTWFDFKNIWLIWIILIEQELTIPEYNTEEKAYTNIKQIIWRGSRLWEKTKTIIQTFIPENETIKMIIESNYKDYFLKTLTERKIFNYPPYTELAILEYRHKDENKSFNFINNLNKKLIELNTQNKIEIILNPQARKKYNQYHYKIILKWKDLRLFLENIKTEILKNSNLSLKFE